MFERYSTRNHPTDREASGMRKETCSLEWGGQGKNGKDNPCEAVMWKHSRENCGLPGL